MRVFVTGGTGFIGGRLVEQLIKADHEVTALVRDPDRAVGLEAMGATLAQGDITDKASMRSAMQGAHAVVHLAAWYDVGVPMAPVKAREINVEGTRNVLELVDELGIERAVYTSTLAVFSDTGGELVEEGYRYDGRHLSVYDRTKWEAHYEVALPMIEEGLALTIVQPGVVYGPGDTSPMGRTLHSYLTGQLPMVPRQTAYCWGHVEDTARGHLLALEEGAPGETYLLAGPPHTLVEALAIAEELTGLPAPRAVPPWVVRAAGWLMTPVNALVGLGPEMHPETLRVSAGVTYLGDDSKARRELGWSPRSLREGLEETLSYEMAQLGIS